jgi:hypothetical protein
MPNWNILTRALATAAVLGVGFADARAQTYGVDYLSFQGAGVVLDNPTSAACQSVNVNYGSTFIVVYRFSNNPSVIADALAFVADDKQAFRIISTTGPNFSLNGTSTVSWSYINRHADFGNGVASTSQTTMTIASGLNAAVTLGTGNIKITNATIQNFFGNTTAGCTINNFHAALVAIPE